MSINTENVDEKMPVLSIRQDGEVAKPPHPLDGQWYTNVASETFGPYSGHHLKDFAEEGRIAGDTQVSRLGTRTWSEASADPVLRHLFAQPDSQPLVASRAAAVGVTHRGDHGTIVQVTNNIQTPMPLDVGADKSPGLALFLSLIFVGLGQIYNGDIGKGIIMFIGCILLWAAFLGWVINIWSMIDAYGRAKELRAKHQAYMARLRAA